MVLPPCTDQGTSPYQGLVIPFNYRSNYYKLYFIDNRAFFSNYCLNFFCATLIGILPQIFLLCSIGSGLEKIIEQNLAAPKIMDLITSPDIYIPLIIFTCLIITTIFLRRLFYNK